MISYNYPTLNQAEEAGLNLFPMLTGQQPRNLAAMLQDCYCIVGYGLSLGFPVPHLAASAAPDAEFAESLKPLTVKAGAGLNIDWKQVLKLALQFILQNLG